MKTEIFATYKKFLARKDKTTNGVSPSFAAAHPEWETDNEPNSGCYNCSRGSECSECYGCSDCYGCSECSECYGWQGTGK